VRITLFGSGSPQSVKALQRLQGRVAHIVVPRAAYAQPLAEAGRVAGVEVLEFGDGLARELKARGTELICIASFPHILRGELLDIPALNLHMSLLPRHRGVDPLFWTYYCADEQAGTTLHWVDAGTDTGDIVGQRAVTLPRGKPSRELYFELCDLGAEMLARAIDAEGQMPRTRQDEARATHDPAPNPGARRIDYGAWPVSRAWHFLAGLSDQRSDLIAGHPHGRALESREGTTHPPGSILQTRTTLEVHCRDGVVVMERHKRGLWRRILGRLRVVIGSP
jgi:methionyl-tRNA formyltransferase